MGLREELRAKKVRAQRFLQQQTANTRQAHQRRIHRWVQDISTRAVTAAFDAAAAGEGATEFRVVEQAIKDGAFWLRDGTLFDVVEQATMRAAQHLRQRGITVEGRRIPTESGSEYFYLVLRLSGW